MEGYDQRVMQPDNWLTHLEGKDEAQRQFVKVIHLPIGEAWDEWTQAQWKAWQDEYNPQPEPEDVEPIEESNE